MFFGPNAASPPKNTPGRVDAIVTLSTTGMPHSSNSMPMSRSIHGNAFSWPIATSTSSQGKWTSGSPVGTSCRRPFASLLRRDLLERDAGQLAALVRDRLRHEEVVDRDAFVRRVLLLPRRRLHLVEAGAHDHLHVLAAQPLARCGSSPSRCCRRPARRRACRSSSCGRTTRSRASRCRCGCSPRLPCGPERRGRARAARRCRRIPRPSPRRAAPSRLSIRWPGAELDAEIEHVAHFLVDHRLRAAGTSGICVRIIPPARSSPSNTTHS